MSRSDASRLSFDSPSNSARQDALLLSYKESAQSARLKQQIKLFYGAWLMVRLLVSPLILVFFTPQADASAFLSRLFGQFMLAVFLLLPALFCWRLMARPKLTDAKLLILSSLMLMVYAATAAMFLLIVSYEQVGILQLLYGAKYGLELLLLCALIVAIWRYLRSLPRA